ncbi:MAG: hypothetical protein NMNS01_17350 [Nitrosomonas sp.]|nr:MAG: hypothetical protein NMNS01_17350 [Nitrosomonas sp.]
MSASAWLLGAIHTAKPGHVPTVPNTENHSWVQDRDQKSLINKGVARHVPTVPSVPREIQPPSDQSAVVDIQRERRHAKVLSLLEGQRFALYVDDDTTDPVIATVGIQNVATFELAIPQHSYDGIVLLELIEKYYGEKNANI